MGAPTSDCIPDMLCVMQEVRTGSIYVAASQTTGVYLLPRLIGAQCSPKTRPNAVSNTGKYFLDMVPCFYRAVPRAGACSCSPMAQACNDAKELLMAASSWRVQQRRT